VVDNFRKERPLDVIEKTAQDIAHRGILQPIVLSDRDDSCA
jgi:ParB-like chromosome segregation protein Spo0J